MFEAVIKTNWIELLM